MRRNIVVYPAADLNNAKRSVRADCLHHEADLIAVGIKLNNRPPAVVFLAADVQVAHTVLRDFSEPFCIGTNCRNHFIFKS